MVSALDSLRILILETSGRNGQVALAQNAALIAQRALDQNQRNGRDLAPTVAALLQQQSWKPSDINLVLVSRGPGSYTALRVGMISAKVFAYATGANLIGIDTFAVIAAQAPPEISAVDVVADAQKDRVYLQSFVRLGTNWQPVDPLKVCSIGDWIQQRRHESHATGPGLIKCAQHLPPEIPCLEANLWDPQPESLLRVGFQLWQSGHRDDVKSLEPLYCRPSSAEEQWQALGR